MSEGATRRNPDSIHIGGRKIGADQMPFIIAEAGINHNGDIETAFLMIAGAKAAGADAVKFQTFKAEEFILDPALSFTYTSRGREVTESMLEMFRRHEFSAANWRRIKERCDEVGITFLSTPQNPTDLDLLMSLGITAVKVGSDDFTNLPLLRRYAMTGLPILVSCGMADLSEVGESLAAVGALQGYPTVLLLCTSQYPTPPKDVNIQKLKTLAATFPTIPLGFSDHTQGSVAATLAVGMGACVFEKHFTLDHDLEGPDHWFSEDPAGLRQWIGAIREAHAMLGSPIVEPTAAERDMRTLARRSLVAIRDIPRGEILTEDNLGLRRPGDGLPPRFWESAIGKTAARPLSRGQQILMEDFQ